MKTFHMIANPAAGKNKSDKNITLVQETFARAGIQLHTHLSTGVGSATQIARRLTENGETQLIALGGDGTLHEVLNGLVDPSKCNLGLIPSGTGNDFAEHLALPLKADEAALRILEGEAKPMDYLDVSGVRCMNVGGLGIDVDVLERCKRGKLKGKIKYLLSLIHSLFTYKGYRVEIVSEEVCESREVLLAAACNGSQFGGGLRICPVANAADGKIDAVIVDCLGGIWKIIKAFTYLMKGKILDYPATKRFTCDKLKFLTEKPCTVQLDGELYTGLSFDVSVKQGLHFYY